MSSASRLTSPFFNDHQWSQETASTNDSSQSSLFSQASQPSTQPSHASSLIEPDLEADLDQEQQDDIDEDSPEGWIAYLSAQYQTHIVDSLKQTVFEKIDQLKASVASLQQNHARQEQASAASVGELKATHDQIFSTLRDLKPIPSRLSALERDVRQNKEQASHALSDLDDKVESLKTDLGIKHDGAMRGLKSAQQQNQSLLETLEALQKEVRSLGQQQTQANGRLFSFQSQLEKTLAPHQGLPEGAMDFLKQLLSRRADLMGLMESPTTATRGANVPLLEEGKLSSSFHSQGKSLTVQHPKPIYLGDLLRTLPTDATRDSWSRQLRRQKSRRREKRCHQHLTSRIRSPLQREKQIQSEGKPTCPPSAQTSNLLIPRKGCLPPKRRKHSLLQRSAHLLKPSSLTLPSRKLLSQTWEPLMPCPKFRT